MLKKLFIFLVLFPVSFLLYAGNDIEYPPETGFWSFQFENDLWGSNDDRFYTHGTEISYASAKNLPNFMQRLANKLPFYHQGELGLHGYSVGQKIFTPEDISQAGLAVNDRPYAGWLFVDAGMAHVFEGRNGNESINGLVFTLGLVGPYSYAEETQKNIHRLVESEVPRGWSNQLGTELGVNVTYVRKWRNLFRLENEHQIEFSHHGGVALGNVYTYLAAGIMGRWGTQLQNDIGPPSINPGFPGVPAFRPSPAFNWYLFAGLEVRAMGRNIFLDGNTFHDSHSVEKQPFVTDVQFGVAFHYKDMRLSFSNLVRSKEFKGQVERTQYGAINITVYAL